MDKEIRKALERNADILTAGYTFDMMNARDAVDALELTQKVYRDQLADVFKEIDKFTVCDFCGSNAVFAYDALDKYFLQLTNITAEFSREYQKIVANYLDDRAHALRTFATARANVAEYLKNEIKESEK